MSRDVLAHANGRARIVEGRGWRRAGVALVVFSTLGAGGLAACDADVESGCVGTCPPAEEAFLPAQGAGGSPTTSGGGDGAGAAGGGEGGAGGMELPPCDFDQCATDVAGPSEGIIPCDVNEVLDAKCRRCHTDTAPEITPPFTLLTYGDTQQLYGTRTVYAVMKSAAVESNFMPLNPPKLDADEKAILRAWICDCAPSAPAGTVCE